MNASSRPPEPNPAATTPSAGPDPGLPDAVAAVATRVAAVVTRRHAAAGVLWRPGLVVTSAAALWRAPRAQLVLPGGEAVEATLRGVDAGTDLALLQYAPGAAETTPAAQPDTSARPEGASPASPASPAASAAVATPEVRVGDFVFAAGREPEGSVHASFGHVGATGGAWRSWRGGRVDQLIRLDGGLYPGLAGAAVATARGTLLGIASPAFHRHHGVVVPVATIERVLDALLAHGRVPRSHLGIAVQPVRATLEGAGVEGLLVSSVAEGSPAALGGLLVGDVIVEAGGHAARELEALRARIADTAPGAPLALVVSRAGRRLALSIAVAEAPRGGCH